MVDGNYHFREMQGGQACFPVPGRGILQQGHELPPCASVVTGFLVPPLSVLNPFLPIALSHSLPLSSQWACPEAPTSPWRCPWSPTAGL